MKVFKSRASSLQAKERGRAERERRKERQDNKEKEDRRERKRHKEDRHAREREVDRRESEREREKNATRRGSTDSLEITTTILLFLQSVIVQKKNTKQSNNLIAKTSVRGTAITKDKKIINRKVPTECCSYYLPSQLY